jgi:trk system potassium uptake protein
MKQFAIIGLGSFGLRMLEELLEYTSEIIIIDKDRDVVDKYKDKAKAAYITDAINETALRKIIPPEIDAVIVDLGGKIEVSIMTTNYLKKMGIREILVKAQTDEHGEVLEMVGATRVVFPDHEAAVRITPMLASSVMFNFMPISRNFALAEVRTTEACIGKSLRDSNLRERFGLNVVAIRHRGEDEFGFISDPSYVFTADDALLVAGSEESIHSFSQEGEKRTIRRPGGFLKHFFRQK